MVKDGSSDILEYQEFTKSRRIQSRSTSKESDKTKDGGCSGMRWKESSRAIASTSLDHSPDEVNARGLMDRSTSWELYGPPLSPRWTVSSTKARNSTKEATAPAKKAHTIRRREGSHRATTFSETASTVMVKAMTLKERRAIEAQLHVLRDDARLSGGGLFRWLVEENTLD